MVLASFEALVRPERARDASGDVPRASGDLRNRSLHGESSPECRKAKNYPSCWRFPLKPACPSKNHGISIGKPLKNDENQWEKPKNPKI